MSEARQFLLDDITALIKQDITPVWLHGVNDDGLYKLWQDLVNLTLAEAN